MALSPLGPAKLYRTCDLEQIPFTNTGEVEGQESVLGQPRALEAIQFGIGIRREGYNLYLAGSKGLGKQTAVREVIEQKASCAPTPSDWCYVNNFQDIYRPLALQLPPGRGRNLRHSVETLLKDLFKAIPAAFQSEEYRTRAQEITQEFEEREEQAFAGLGEKAQQRGIALISTPSGYTLAPVRDGKPLASEDFDKLGEKEKAEIQETIGELKQELKNTIRRIPLWNKESAARFDALNSEFAALTVDQCSEELREAFADLPHVLCYLDALKEDVVAHKDDFLPHDQQALGPLQKASRQRDLQRYEVNVLIDHAETQGAPVVYEANPTYQNIVGRVEHIAQMGTLTTNFTLIKPGALHKANGGYLLLEARKVLGNPFAWESLKRVLHAREIRIESLEQMLSIVSTTSLEPESIPLDVKVVLTGDRLLYYLLKEYDPEFGLLFKVTADFSESFARNRESTQAYARLIAGIVDQDALRPFDKKAVGRVIEHSSRLVGDGERLSLHMGRLTDLLREADFWAGERGSDRVLAEHVGHAIGARVRRADQYRERVYEEIRRGTLLVDTSGTRVAQVNGLSVVQLADFSFGQPVRITATARLGDSGVLDIERESELGGRLHSKGVMILASCLAGRYAPERPLPLAASLVFEQSYGTVEGDSASVAEYCALISALTRLPIRQHLAVTGSLNQHGQVQAIGGVNQKVEGFFDVCRARGLDGRQGVIIPESNVKHLMLRGDVVEAAAAGRFHVFAVEHVDEVIELLTGVTAGEADETGGFPRATVNAMVSERLQHLCRLQQQYAKAGKERTVRDGPGSG